MEDLWQQKKVAPKANYRPSPPSIVKPVTALPLEAIIRAVRVARELSGEAGAKLRWGWHPLYLEAVEELDF